MHYTERCIEVRPRYLFDKFRFAGEFGSIVSYGRINYKNSHSSANCCGCSLPYEHRAFSGKGGCSLLLRRNSARLFAASAPFVRLCERLQDGRGRNVGRMLLKLLERCSGRAVGEI